MFERRLKIFLAILFLAALVLAGRAAQVQVWQHAYWSERASETMRHSQLIDTTRGRILDYRGREIAADAGCIDACVDYRALQIQPEERWLRGAAAQRLADRMGEAYRALPPLERKARLDAEVKQAHRDIDAMWGTLAQISGQGRDAIDETRRAIVQRVEMRRRYLWFARYQNAVTKFNRREPSPWYRQWLIDDTQEAPQVDSFAITIGEQTQAHPILRDVSPEVRNFLGKNLERFPGLVLRPSTHRIYPYKDVAAHVLGHLSRVSKEDLQNDPNGGVDELRQYLPNDLIGRAGIEALCEQTLRGSRGCIERSKADHRIIDSQSAQPGKDVRLTLDIELQAEMQALFQRVRYSLPEGGEETHEMHGAAVVIALPSGQVRALVSYPSYDANRFDELYPMLATDEINTPLLNRATQAQLEPGSTVKPMVGMAAITAGLARVDEGIECTGYLVLGGRKIEHGGRCWIASKFLEQLGGNVAHHPVPWDAPHPTGFLCLADAIERSCNVYFETMADRLGAQGLSHWLGKFGLGRPTGIGIAESSGRLPEDFAGPRGERRMTVCLAGIGQGQISATPLQMANVAATLARNGVWRRPQLVADPPEATVQDEPLGLSPAAVAAAREGMTRVVNSKAGTGDELRRPDVLIAGKTGTAQAARFSVPLRDEAGRLVRDEQGRPRRRFLEPSTPAHPNPEAPWYRGTGRDNMELNHAWFIGFAPARRPQIAFAVLIEYGGSGGRAAASIAKSVLESCVEHGYLSLEKTDGELAQP